MDHIVRSKEVVYRYHVLTVHLPVPLLLFFLPRRKYCFYIAVTCVEQGEPESNRLISSITSLYTKKKIE